MYILQSGPEHKDLAYLADSAPDAGKDHFHSFFWTAASRPAGLPRGAWGVAQGRDRPRPLIILPRNWNELWTFG